MWPLNWHLNFVTVLLLTLPAVTNTVLGVHLVLSSLLKTNLTLLLSFLEHLPIRTMLWPRFLMWLWSDVFSFRIGARRESFGRWCFSTGGNQEPTRRKCIELFCKLWWGAYLLCYTVNNEVFKWKVRLYSKVTVCMEGKIRDFEKAFANTYYFVQKQWIMIHQHIFSMHLSFGGCQSYQKKALKITGTKNEMN